MKRCFIFVILMAFVWVSGLTAREQDLLKESDISRIMKQILEHHAGTQEVSDRVLRNSLKIYIDQFDPRRIYLLESEITPFIQLSQEQLNRITQQYKNGDFSIFTQLNDVIQKSIERSRKMRGPLKEEAKTKLFQLNGKKNEKLQEYETFARSQEELKTRLWEDIERFIQLQRNRFNDSAVIQKKNEILQSYEARLRDFEEEYLFTDAKGHPLPQAEQDNLFTIHVLKALASSLDAHTSFYQANEAYDMRVRLQKQFQGIGLVLKDQKEGIVVVRIFEGSPAARSGLIQEGDILLEINHQSVKDYPFDKIMEMLHKSNQDELNLVFKRKGSNGQQDKIFPVKLKQELIVLDSDRVDSSYESFGNGIIGKIVLHSFYQGNGITSEKDVRDAIQKLQSKGNLKGLILDLRDNSGGFLSQAIKVAGLFVTNGVIVISKYSDGEERIYRDVDGKAIYDGPLVILTSKITASAAEIVAQALQDYGVAVVVGDEHTYGKGTIQTQTVTNNQSSSSYFKVTVGKYYTVSGKTPQKEGVKADIIVPGRWNNEMIGEEYLANAPSGDQIPSTYKDSLEDISPDVKSWYLKYYIPKLQQRKSTWTKIMPTLRKNSGYRIEHNKNYQFFLKNKTDNDEELDEEEELGIISHKKKNFGVDDLQMQEAVNIVKDMIILHSLELDLESQRHRN